MNVRFSDPQSFDSEAYDSPETKILLMSYLMENHLAGITDFQDGIITRERVEGFIQMNEITRERERYGMTDTTH